MSTHKKRQHYVSQGYLKGFTLDYGDQLISILLDQGKATPNNIKNIAQRNHFNRLIRSSGPDDSLEDFLSKEIEEPAIKSIASLSSAPSFKGDAKQSILLLMALFYLNNPATRQMRNSLNSKLAELYLSLLPDYVGKTVNGLEVTDDLAQLCKHLKVHVEIPQNDHIIGALQLIKDVANSMNSRKWTLFQAPSDAHYLTCDTPVRFRWNMEELINTFSGYECLNSHIIFPVSKELVLMGDFNGNEGTVTATPEIVGIINSNIIANARSQVYAPSENFYFVSPEGHLLRGVDNFLNHYNSIPIPA